MAKYTYNSSGAGANGTLDTPKSYELSSSRSDAIVRIAHAELTDKTFLLLTVLTISWSLYHSDDSKHEKEKKDDIDEELQIYVNKDNIFKTHGHVVGR